MKSELHLLRQRLAPSGRLRVAINLGNAMLARQAGPDGELGGLSVLLARHLAERLELPLDLLPYRAAGEVVADAGRQRWDLAFLARDPERARTIAYSAPYARIEGCYLVAADSPCHGNAQLDRPGMRIAVGRGAAYDLYLSRTLQRAQLIRAATTPGAVALFLEQGLDAAAGIRGPLRQWAATRPGFRLLEENFMIIEQALAVPRGEDDAIVAGLDALLAELRQQGLLAQWCRELSLAELGLEVPTVQ